GGDRSGGRARRSAGGAACDADARPGGGVGGVSARVPERVGRGAGSRAERRGAGGIGEIATGRVERDGRIRCRGAACCARYQVNYGRTKVRPYTLTPDGPHTESRTTPRLARWSGRGPLRARRGPVRCHAPRRRRGAPARSRWGGSAASYRPPART